MARSKVPSEFGGVPGRIQPLPHNLSEVSYEQARLERATDPADPTDTAEAALVRERRDEGRSL